jgi:replicative DNA helicase
MSDADERLSDLAEERNLLSCVLRSQDAWLRVSDQLTVEDFTHPINKALWVVLNDAREGNSIPSPVSVYDKLPKDIQEKVDAMGGWDFISKLAEIPVEPLNVEKHAERLNELSILRRGREAGAAIQRLALKAETSETFLEGVEEIVNEIPGEVGSDVTLLGSIVVDYVAEKRAHPKEIPGIATKYQIFDAITQGLQPGRLYVLAARSGLGKSIWCLNLVKNIAIDQELPVLYISTEQTQKDELSRLIGIVGEVPEAYFNNGTFIQMNDYPERVDYAEKVIKNAPIYFSHDPMFTPEKLYRTIKKFVLVHGVKAVFFDYIKIPTGNVGSHDKWALVGDLAYGLKAIASKLEVPVISAVQVNRDGSEQFRSTGEIDDSAFALSDMILQASSVAMVLRPLNKAEKESNPDFERKRVLTFAKNRHGSKSEKLLFTLDQEFVRLRELNTIAIT